MTMDTRYVSRSPLAAWLGPVLAIAMVMVLCLPASSGAQISRVGATTTVYAPGFVRGTHVAYDPVNDIYLVVMGAGSVWGRFVNTAGQPVGAPFTIHAQSGTSYAKFPIATYSPHVSNGAGGQGGFLVTWNDGESGIPDVIRGRLVAYEAPGGIVSAEVTIGDAVDGGSFFEQWPAVAYSKTSRRFLVAWTTGAWSIRGRLIDTSLAPITNVARFENPGGSQFPSAVWNPSTDQFGLIYSQWGASGAWVAFRRVAADGTPSARWTFGVSAGTFETAIDVTSTYSYVLSWGLGPGAKSAVFDASGNPVLDSSGGVNTTFLSSRMGHNQSLDLAYNPLSDTLLAVSSDLGGTNEVGAVEVTAAGSPLSFLLATDGAGTGSFYPKTAARLNAKHWNVVYARNQTEGTDQIIAIGAAAPVTPGSGTGTTPGSTTGGCTTVQPATGWTCVNGGWLPPGATTGSPTTSCTTVQPGAGWTCVNGGWLPSGSTGTGTCTTPDPFTSIGGGTCVNGGWRPKGA